jgi:hypothetical protein
MLRTQKHLHLEFECTDAHEMFVKN